MLTAVARALKRVPSRGEGGLIVQSDIARIDLQPLDAQTQCSLIIALGMGVCRNKTAAAQLDRRHRLGQHER
jgi:hypothetical protein